MHLLEEIIFEKVGGIDDRMKVMEEDFETIKTEMKQKSESCPTTRTLFHGPTLAPGIESK